MGQDCLPETRAAADRAAQRLHHLSMCYVGAMWELAHDKPLGMLSSSHPGLKSMRDLIDLVLLCRAEINALTKLLLDANLIDGEKVAKQFAEEYEWFAQQKAKLFGVEVTDYGLHYNLRPKSEA